MSAAARDQIRREADAAARRDAQREFAAPMILEAGAGTGKTAVLVGRIVCWSVGPGWETSRATLGASAHDEEIAARLLDRVVAITFTEKAAAEMAVRVAEAFSKLRQGEAVVGLELDTALEDQELRARALALLTRVDRLHVGTIHAFCRSLIARHPLEAGVHPNFEVDADQSRLHTTVTEVMTEALPLRYGAAPDPDAIALAARGYGPDRVATVLRSLASDEVPAAWLREDPYSPERVLACRGRLAAEAGEILAVIEAPLQGAKVGRSPNTLPAVELLQALRDDLPRDGSIEAILAALPLETTGPMARIADWGGSKGPNKTETPYLGELMSLIADPCSRLVRILATMRKVDPVVLPAAGRLLADLLEQVAARLETRGAVTFSGLLRKARDLLRDDAGARARVRAAFDQILVDEFQDTDPIQYEIVGLLALDGGESENPGLFLVGDPKQSIYAWRQADLAAYQRFLERVMGSGGRRHSLSVNFRSVPAVLDEVERLVAPVMVTEPGVQPEFESLLAAPQHLDAAGFTARERRPVEHWVAWRVADSESSTRPEGPATKADDAREIEARALARDLRELKEVEGFRWSEVGILARAMTSQETWLRALREAGVPYVIERDRNYYQRREVVEALALVRTILDPQDHVSLVAFLRSAVVGVPDAALIPLWAQGLPEHLTALADPGDAAVLAAIEAAIAAAERALPRGAPGLEELPGWPAALRAAVAALAALRRAFATEPADRFLARLRAVLLPEVSEAARFLGPTRLANLERFHRLVLELLARHGGGAAALLRELRLTLEEQRADLDAAPAESDGDAVRFMSIHGAKGLTFRHTYLIGLHGESGGRGRPGEAHVVLTEGGPEMVIFGARSLGYDAVSAREEKVSRAEEVRTLYVAATRAKERLVLCGKRSAEGKVVPLEKVKAHADLLTHRRGDRPGDAELLASAGRARIDADGVRWFVPESEGEEVRYAEGRLPESIDPAPAKAMATRLARERAAAELRMQRPLTGAVTSSTSEDPLEADVDFEDDVSSEVEPPTAHPVARADAVGSVIHRILEVLPLGRDLESALRSLEPMAVAAIAELVSPAEAAAVEHEVRDWMDRFPETELAAELRRIAGGILGRELPFVARPEEHHLPTGATIGVIDLLYRDPRNGEVVVADYKSDRIGSATAIREVADRYAAQARGYLRAVQEALGLADPPRFELWLLGPDRIVPIEVKIRRGGASRG